MKRVLVSRKQGQFGAWGWPSGDLSQPACSGTTKSASTASPGQAAQSVGTRSAVGSTPLRAGVNDEEGDRAQ